MLFSENAFDQSEIGGDCTRRGRILSFVCVIETFKFPLLKEAIFPPHQTFHITTRMTLMSDDSESVTVTLTLKLVTWLNS